MIRESGILRFWSLYFVLLGVAFTSCARIYGIRTKNPVSVDKIQRVLLEECPECLFGILQRDYFSYIDSVTAFNPDSEFNRERHFRSQPLSAHLFHGNDEILMISNCMTGGFPNLKWENSYDLVSDIPIGRITFEFQTSFNDHKRFMQLPTSIISNNEEYYLVLHVVPEMKRQSRRMVKHFSGLEIAGQLPKRIILISPYFK